MCVASKVGREYQVSCFNHALSEILESLNAELGPSDPPVFVPNSTATPYLFVLFDLSQGLAL